MKMNKRNKSVIDQSKNKSKRDRNLMISQETDSPERRNPKND
jgi:hypothetical protein